MIKYLLLLLLLVEPPTSFSGFAPDVAPDLPEGWCNLVYGTPTRTTGECICKQECEGKGCHRQQGFIFYSYSECPTCQCVAGSKKPKVKVNTDKGEVSDNSEKTADEEAAIPRAPKISKVKSFSAKEYTYHDADSEVGEEKDILFSMHEFVEDNGKYFIAGIVSLLVLLVVIATMYTSSSKDTPKHSSEEREKEETKKETKKEHNKSEEKEKEKEENKKDHPQVKKD